MKVVAFNGSARKDGNTAILIRYVLGELEKEGIETQMVQLAGKNIHGCRACRKCVENKDKRCSFDDDVVNDCIEKMLESEGIILGSPTYLGGPSSEIKALIDRAGFVALWNGKMLRKKVGAAVVAERRAGAIHVFHSINNLFLMNEMIVPGSIYWNLGLGREKGEVENDPEGIETMEALGRNMAWLLKKLHP
jgi:multimeric flavodoxin WrbA